MAYNIDSSKGTFQSTPSAWRVTLITFMYFPFFVISIHTLRVEGDTQAAAFPTEESVISIHTLRVEGDPLHALPVGVVNISIHTLRVEGDTVESALCGR